MAGSKSDYLENKVLNLVLGAQAYSAPATVYIALFTSAPSDTGGGTECTGGTYSRYTCTNNTTNWPVTANGQKSNGVDFVFATATASWGLVTAFGIFDAPSGGNLLYWGTLTSNKQVDIGDTPIFRAGTLIITED